MPIRITTQRHNSELRKWRKITASSTQIYAMHDGTMYFLSVTCSWWTVEQASLRWSNPYPLEQLWVEERQLDDFSQFANLFTQTTDTRVSHVTGVFVRHVVNQGINFSRKVPGTRGNGDKYDSIKWRTYDSEKWRKYDFVLAKKLNRYDAWFP